MFAEAIPYMAAGFVLGSLLLAVGSRRLGERFAVWSRRTSVRLGLDPRSLRVARRNHTQPVDLQLVNADVASWTTAMADEYVRTTRILAVLSFCGVAYNATLLLIAPPLLRTAGWSYDQYTALVAGSTLLAAAVILAVAVPPIVRYTKVDTRLRSSPGNLSADTLLGTTADDLQQYHALQRLVGPTPRASLANKGIEQNAKR